MSSYGQELLTSLSKVRWHVAVHTFGNNHATLIGLLVDWWITASLKNRWALEGGPAFGYRKRGQGGGGQCDALLGEGENVVGVLEVEGTRPAYAAEKIGNFFRAEYEEFKTLKFGILLVYAYQATGVGEERRMRPAGDEEVLNAASAVSNKYSDKPVIVITLDKAYERQNHGARRRNEYYWSRPITIRGLLCEGGREISQQSYYGTFR